MQYYNKKEIFSPKPHRKVCYTFLIDDTMRCVLNPMIMPLSKFYFYEIPGLSLSSALQFHQALKPLHRAIGCCLFCRVIMQVAYGSLPHRADLSCSLTLFFPQDSSIA